MKNLKVYTLAALLLAAIPCLKAQDSEVRNDEIVTLVGNSNHIGGYGAFSVRYFDLDKRDGIMLGGRGGIIVGHGISFGLTGTGFLTQSIYDPLLGEDAMLAGGYGGIYIEPILFPRSPVHLSFPITFGGGGIGYNTTHYDDDNRYDWDDDYIGGAGFLLVEPGVEVEFNVMKYFRLALGASYKFTSDFNLRYDNIGDNRRVIANNALNGFTGGITFKFGVF